MLVQQVIFLEISIRNLNIIKMQEQNKNAKEIIKLEKQIIELQKQLTLQSKQKEIIKNYKMNEGDYQILISIYEANDLMPRGTDFWLFKTDKTACDAFVQIQIRDQIQKTTIKKDTNNPIFDQKFYFQFKGMTLQELDRANITLRLYDKKKFILRDSLIGSFQVDWTNVYFKRNHQIYRGWLTLMDPFDEEEGVTGYLLVSIAVLGQNDKVTVHDSAFIKDPLTTIQDTITMPKLQLIDYGINIQIYRGQNLIPLDQFAGNVDAYVIAKFSGNKIDTSIKSSCNPQWDQLLRIGTAVPTKSKYVLLQVRNRNYMFGDDIIGVIKIPFVDIKQQSQPRWGHLYGPPMSGKDYQPYNFATKMQIYGEQMGSHYRGRILYKITAHKDLINKNRYFQYYFSRTKINFKFPFKPTPVVPLKSYSLRLQVLDGFNLPDKKNRDQCYIHYCLGQYMTVSKTFGQIKMCLSFLQKFQDRKVQLPQDYTQIPDLIIYLAKGQKEKDRISYVRIPAKDIISHGQKNPMNIYNLKADLTLNNITKDQSGGYITARAHLFTDQPPESRQSLITQFGKKSQFVLRIFLYRARQLPPMNETGDVDPKLVFHFCGVEAQKKSDSTYNPIWNQVVTMEVQCQDIMTIDLQKALVCNVYDIDQGKKDNLIGNFMVKLSRKNKRIFKNKLDRVDFIYQKPQWYPIINEKVDIGDPCFGHVLLGCALFRRDDMKKLGHHYLQKQTFNQLTQKRSFQLFIVGARGLEQLSSHIDHKKIQFQIKVGKNNSLFSKQAEIKNQSANINQMIEFDVNLPKNRSIIPYMDIKVFEKKNDTRKFAGFASISLYDMVPKILKDIKTRKQNQANQEEYEQIQQELSQDTLINLDELQKQLSVVRQRKRKRMQKYKEQQKKKQIFDVQVMKAPKQLASTTDNSDKNDLLEQLLQKFQNEYKDDPKYSFVSNIQEQKDKETSKKILQRDSRLIKQKQKSIMIEQPQEDEQKQRMINRRQQETNTKMFKIQKVPHSGFIDLQLQQVNTDKNKKGFKQLQPDNNYFTQNKTKTRNKSTTKTKTRTSNILFIQDNIKPMIALVNSQKSLREDYQQIQNRYGDRKTYQFDENSEQKSIENFDMDMNYNIKQIPYNQRAIKYKDVQRIIKQEQKFTKQAMERQQNYKYAAAVKLSLFKSKNKNRDIEVETYQDYDTDPEQNLDIIPEWYKGRKILVTDFQQLVPNKKIRSIPIYQGGNRISKLDIRQKKIVGYLKCIGLVVGQQSRANKQKKYIQLLKPRSYVCRIYVLKGKSLISNLSRKPSTYLRMSCNGQVYELKEATLCKQQFNPEYYVCQQIPMQIPGSSKVRIQVMESVNTLGVSQNKILGYTEIDIEERHFTKKWHLFTQKKPIQLRNLYSQFGNGTQGRLEVWTDIIQKKDWISNPPFKIHPPPFYKFELRVIVWSTKQCVYKNQSFKSNDVFVRGLLGTSQAQQTDTHWACRGLGNFNYRFKFQVSYPPKPQDMYSDQFVVQIWDRDVVGYNNLIGEKRINLNKIHRIIQKAVKRKKQVKAKMKIRERGLVLTEKFWFDVYNHKAKDQFGQLQSQGKVQLSFQLVPFQKAQTSLKNGFGRSDPNVFPTLQQPAGRLNFNILHPLDFFKQLCGPQLYHSMCYKFACCILLLIVILYVYFLTGTLMTTAIVKSTCTTTKR